jgi:hypothetical protein
MAYQHRDEWKWAMMTVTVQPVRHLRIINLQVVHLAPLAAPAVLVVHPAEQLGAHLELGKRDVIRAIWNVWKDDVKSSLP